jgi:hypothetical protein
MLEVKEWGISRGNDDGGILIGVFELCTNCHVGNSSDGSEGEAMNLYFGGVKCEKSEKYLDLWSVCS